LRGLRCFFFVVAAGRGLGWGFGFAGVTGWAGKGVGSVAGFFIEKNVCLF
jgi:hypothetical protein